MRTGYTGTYYLYQDGYRYKRSITVRDRSKISKQALLYRLQGVLAGYTVIKNDELIDEWWDRQARRWYAVGKDGSKGEL